MKIDKNIEEIIKSALDRGIKLSDLARSDINKIKILCIEEEVRYGYSCGSKLLDFIAVIDPSFEHKVHYEPLKPELDEKLDELLVTFKEYFHVIRNKGICRASKCGKFFGRKDRLFDKFSILDVNKYVLKKFRRIPMNKDVYPIYDEAKCKEIYNSLFNR